MCLAIPGRIVEISDNEVIVDYDGEKKKVMNTNINLKKGDLVLVELGMVTRKLTKKEADQRLKLFE